MVAGFAEDFSVKAQCLIGANDQGLRVLIRQCKGLDLAQAADEITDGFPG